MPARLSSPLTELKDTYEAVVVGSGYGGAIAASRLARAGKQVCLLERGRELQPGEYPDTVPEAAREFQVDGPAGHLGDEAGLYDLHVNPDICVFVGCGLGGTSLVNANVSLEADPRVFADPRWPAGLRADLNGRLQTGYLRAREMLKPMPLPAGIDTAKLQALRASAAAMGAADRFIRPPINVTFQDGINHVGVEQKACNLCGDCCTGCNHGAKNTVLMNYLPDAHNFGASIFTTISVTHLSRSGELWNVHYRLIGEGREAFKGPEGFVRARTVVLSAGTLGSTGILLRSARLGLPLSDRLGRRFTGNGDVLGFSYNGEVPVRGIGFGHRDPALQTDKVGPCISGAIDLRDAKVFEEGMIVEEGSLPGALAPLLPLAFSADAATKAACTAAQLERAAQSDLEGAYAGAMQNTQTYLVMTHDDGEGTIVLENDRVQVKWPGVGKESIFKRVGDVLGKATVPSKGIYVEDPLSEKFAGQDLITVHPLGGCVMADDAGQGVVNHRGQVFSSSKGDAVYGDLYVSDGSVIPRPLGVNPLLTISALAERTWMLRGEEENWQLDDSLPSKPLPAKPRKLGVRFTERMAGFFSSAVDAGYQPAADEGKRENRALEFILTISSDDLDSFLGGAGQSAGVVGTVVAPSLSPAPLQSSKGIFNLLPPDPEAIETRRMRYRMQLTAEDGRGWFFDGHKVVHNSAGSNPWIDTTTLFFTLQEKDERGPITGKGILRIALFDFARQMTTMEAVNADTLEQRLDAVARFGKHFAGALFDVYGGVAKPLSMLRAEESAPRKKRPLRAPVPELHPLQTNDGAPLRLTRYQAGSKGPVLLSHGIGTSGLLFSIDTVETNLVEYLCAHGYDVWVFDHRLSNQIRMPGRLSNLDDLALQDYPAAVAQLRAVTGAASVQVVAHCAGGAAFMMAQATGLTGVRSAVISQLAAHLNVTFGAKIKNGLHLPEALAELGLSSDKPGWRDTLVDSVLRLEPRGAEACQSPTCHRISFLYGMSYDHAQLDPATHGALHELFGIANLGALEQLALIARRGELVNAKGENVYLDLSKLRLPIALLHGGDNHCYLQKGTQRTLEWLAAGNGPELYSRQVIPGYGNADGFIGRNAARDFFPHILDHLEKTP